MFNIYNRNNGTEHDDNLVRRALQIWKKKATKEKLIDAADIINSNAKIFLNKLYRIKKLF